MEIKNKKKHTKGKKNYQENPRLFITSQRDAKNAREKKQKKHTKFIIKNKIRHYQQNHGKTN